LNGLQKSTQCIKIRVLVLDDQFFDLVNYAEKHQYEKERLIEEQKKRMNSKEYCIPSDL
jgi:hypothetical protein